MPFTVTRFLARTAQSACLIGVLLPSVLARIETAEEIKTIRLSHRNVGLANEAISELCQHRDCTPYSGVKTVAELTREMNLPDRVSPVDAWQQPLRALVTPHFAVVASPGSDGKFDDELIDLFEVRPSDEGHLRQRFALLEQASHRRFDAALRGQLRGEGLDIVRAWGEFMIPSSADFLELDDVPLRLAVRAGLLAAGSLMLFGLLSGALQSPRRMPLRVVQAMCVAAFFLPLSLATRWVTRERVPVRQTFDSINAAAGAIERLACSRKDCRAHPTQQEIYDCSVCKPYPAVAEVPEIAAIRDGWGRPLHVATGAERYVIASGGADGRLDGETSDLLKAVGMGEERFKARSAAMIEGSSSRQMSAAWYRRPYWYQHLDDDFVYGRDTYLRAQVLPTPDSSGAAPGAVLRHYALLTTLPALLILIVTMVMSRKGRSGNALRH